MVFVGGQKLACATCIKGHRSSSCNHTDRSLFAIRPKGRPVSQCEHCRELRKTKQVHVKCECDTKPTGAAAIAGGSGETHLIVARKGARKIKTLEPATATFPNGIQDMVEAAALLSNMTEGAASSSQCTCGSGGTCGCCTDRYVSKKNNKAEGSHKGHANRPSISLTIPPASDNGPTSPGHSHSPSITITPSHPSGSRSHSRSPSRSAQHHALDGHQVAGTQSDHHFKHAALYSPYSAPQHPYSFPQEGLRSPTSSGSNSHNQSPGGNPGLSQSTSTAPTSASPQLLLPSSDLSYHDLSHPSSPLSVDLDRPRSALSIHTGSTGRNTPIDFGPNGGLGDWSPNSSINLGHSTGLGDGIQAMSLMSNSPVLGSPLDQFMAAQSQQQQVGFNGYRQQDTLSPASPGTPHYLLSPTDTSSAQPSPTSYAPADMNQFNLGFSSDPFQQQTPMNHPMQSLMQDANAFNSSGRLSPYSDVFEDDDHPELGFVGNRSRRGSHQSVSSSHSGHLAPQIRLMSASPIPPQPVAALNLGADISLMGSNDGNQTCVNAGQGCHCWSPTGQPNSEEERCQGQGCACCNYIASRNSNPLAGLGLDAMLNNVNANGPNFAVSTERDAGFSTGQNNPMENYGFGHALQIPPFQSRSRSSSSSSHSSNHSHISQASSGPVPTPNTTASLSRHNSTGQIGRGKFKPILPKPAHGASASVSYQSGPSGFANLSLQPTRPKPHSAGPSSPSGLMGFNNQFQGGGGGLDFAFPRPASSNDMRQPSPAVIVTEPPPNENQNNMLAFDQLMQQAGLMSSANNSPVQADPFNFGQQPIDPSSSASSLFEAAAAASPTPSRSHSRNHSQPNAPPSPSFGNTNAHLNANTHGRSQSQSYALLQEPKPMPYGHGRSSSTSLLDARSIEVIVTAPSPFNTAAPNNGGSPS